VVLPQLDLPGASDVGEADLDSRPSPLLTAQVAVGKRAERILDLSQPLAAGSPPLHPVRIRSQSGWTGKSEIRVALPFLLNCKSIVSFNRF